jgi:arylsulfatase
MAEPFGGVVNVDIRDSEPDWSPFEAPRAPEGAPNVVYVVLDDVGFAAMSCTAARSRRPTSTASRPRGCATPSGTPPRCAHPRGRVC